MILKHLIFDQVGARGHHWRSLPNDGDNPGLKKDMIKRKDAFKL
jgi:hypothetical protein